MYQLKVYFMQLSSVNQMRECVALYLQQELANVLNTVLSLPPEMLQLVE